MPVTLYIAPAGHGKTRHVLNLVRERTRDLNGCPRVCVANHQQVAAWQRRLAYEGGCIGAQVQTFDGLYTACLTAAAEPYTRIGDVVQYRLLRAIIAALRLQFYDPVRAFPGFIQECQSLIDEMKSAQITPQRFLDAVRQTDAGPRLEELAAIYVGYEHLLHENQLVDARGLGWLALRALGHGAAHVARDWSPLILDGFASFTQTQLSVLRLLQQRVQDVVITLTGDPRAPDPRACHRHFARTRQRIEDTLGVQAQYLPGASPVAQTLFASLEATLFCSEPSLNTAQTAERAAPVLSLLAVPDHAAEVRVALRWLKRRIVEDGISVHDACLTARSVEPYRPFITQTAAEFGLPVYFVDEAPLQRNPCVAAILTLLRLLLPAPGATVYSPSLPRRAFIATLRSPYFDWQALASADDENRRNGLESDDVDALDAVGRWGRVIGGVDQWWEILERLAAMEPVQPGSQDVGAENGSLPSYLPRGQRALDLQDRLRGVLQRLTLPQERAPCSEFVRWLEDLIGPDVQGDEGQSRTSLNILGCVRQAEAPVAERDIAALRRLKDLLRGLIWVEQVGIDVVTIDYTQFYDELAGAAESATVRAGSQQSHDAILVSDVIQGRGVPCRALAVLGLAEGLFPATLAEEPFLRERDRATLREAHALPLESAIESHEQEYFYETITRARDWLLFTRPSQAESGTLWEPSPFWGELQRLTGVREQAPDLEAASPASTVELLSRLAECDSGQAYDLSSKTTVASRWRGVCDASAIFRARWAQSPTAYDGLLEDHGGHVRARFGASYGWSASRFESYLTCPLQFFFSSVLRVEPRPEPQEGLDARQLGNIYHRLMEETYRRLPPSQRNDVEQLQASLRVVAERVLAEAPRREGFRETAWWHETRREIRRNVEQSLAKLAELPGDFIPTHFELFFGGARALYIERAGERVQVRGVVDRVDVDPEGRLRVIDYKTAGSYGYTGAAHRTGKRLQLPLYALATEEALRLGAVADGFYWHVQHAEPSAYSLQDEEPRAAMQTAVDHAWRAVDGARSGNFSPQPPDGGCPDYCPGAGFCWRYQPRRSF